MANGTGGKAGECTFEWKVINISLCRWLGKREPIVSPAFGTDGLNNTKWTLRFYPMGFIDDGSIDFHLHRKEDCSGPDIVKVKYQLAILHKNGSFFKKETKSNSFMRNDFYCFRDFLARETIFITERESLLPHDTLTVQCTIWNEEDKPIKSKYLYAHTIFKSEPSTLVWKIAKFRSCKLVSRNKFKNRLIDFDLILNARKIFEKNMKIIINASSNDMKYFWFKTYIIDSQGKKKNCGMNEYFADDLKKGVLYCKLHFPEKFMLDPSLYFPNDYLCLHCEFVCSTETALYELFERGVSSELEDKADENHKQLGKEISRNTTFLANDLKSMYSDAIFSDMELCTSTRTFAAHKAVLSARSSVFRRMFSNDMKEKNSGRIDISDLEDDTVHRMLLYIYTDTLEDLQLESASKLYSASDKYDIHSLKLKCTSFLKKNLCPTKACDVLIMADQHQDEDLKEAVQDYILVHEEVFASEKWMHFMENHSRLAADVMYRKINPGKFLQGNAADVTFCNKTFPTDGGFTIYMSLKMNYDEMACAVARRLNTDPYSLQFFKTTNSGDGPGAALSCTYKGTLKELLMPVKDRRVMKIYYQLHNIKVSVLENKMQFKCTWFNSKLKEEKQLVLYPMKNGVVADLLEEAKKQVEMSENGSGRLRLLEIISSKIFALQREVMPLDSLANAGTNSLRIEEIPVDELEIADDELLIPVAHFQKEVFFTFGVPFLLKIKHKEPFQNVKERIQKKLEVPDREFEQYKFAIIVMGRPHFITDEMEYYVNLPDFLLYPQIDNVIQPRPWLGLEHENESQKRSRYN